MLEHILHPVPRCFLPVLLQPHAAVRIAKPIRGKVLTQHFEGVWLELPLDAVTEEQRTQKEQWPWNTHLTDTSFGIHTQDMNGTVRALIDRGISLEGMRVKTPTLDDLFLELTGRDLRS